MLPSPAFLLRLSAFNSAHLPNYAVFDGLQKPPHGRRTHPFVDNGWCHLQTCLIALHKLLLISTKAAHAKMRWRAYINNRDTGWRRAQQVYSVMMLLDAFFEGYRQFGMVSDSPADVSMDRCISFHVV